MDSDEDESVMFQTDDESVDFQSEADNMSFMSRGSRRTGRGSARNTPHASHAQPAAAVPTLAVVAAPESSTSSDSDDSEEPQRKPAMQASPRGLTATSTGKLTTQTLAAHNVDGPDVPKKTVVSATLRARAASQRGRSPGLASPPAAAPPPSAPKPTESVTAVAPPDPPVLESTSRPQLAAQTVGIEIAEVDSDSPGDVTPPQAAAPRPHHFDAAGVSRMMQLMNHKGRIGEGIGEGPPPTSFRITDVESEPSAAPSPNELHLDLMAIQQHQRALAEHHAKVEAMEFAHRRGESEDTTHRTAAPTREPTRLMAADSDRRAEAVRVSLGWYRDLNAELAKETDSLERRLYKERASLALDDVDRAAASQQRRDPPLVQPHPTALRTEHRAFDRASSKRESMPPSTASRTRASSKGAPSSRLGSERVASPARAAPAPAEKPLDGTTESAVRAVAGRYGVVLPSKPLTGDSQTAVALPDRLFFATGVQLTRSQRVELLDRMRAAVKSHATARNPSEPLPFSETELGSRASSLLRMVQDNKSRVTADSSSPRRAVSTDRGLNAAANQGPATAPAGGGGQRGAPDWAPFTGPMRQRTRESSVRRNKLQVPLIPEHALSLMPKCRKRTEVLRDVFASLTTHGRNVLHRHDVAAMHTELLQARSGSERISIFADLGLQLRSALVRHDRHTVLAFIVDLVAPLLLLSGFEEFDFPIFSQIMLRVADREALPSDFAFQPTAQSPLAARNKTGDREPALDIAASADRMNSFLSDLCTGTAVGNVFTVRAATR